MDLTPQVLKDVEFREKFRGYDPDEVDAFLEQVGTAIGQLQNRLKAAMEQRGSAAPSEPARLQDPEGALSRVLLAAQETADRVVGDAETEASAMVAEAETKSSALIAEADEHSEKVRAAAAAEARRALEEAREPLMAELADLRSDRERLHTEVTALEQYLDTERADVIATIEQLQSVLADPSALRLGKAPSKATESDDPGSAGGGSATASSPIASSRVDASVETEPPPVEPLTAPAVMIESEPEPAPSRVEPDDPSPSAQAADVVVDLTVDARPAPAMAATADEVPWAQGGEVIHGAFAPAAEDAPLDLIDPDGGPPTEAYLNLFDEGSGETGDRFLDELRRAVDDGDDALGTPDEEADAAMAAFFDQDEEDPKFGRR